jgi:hypothetical protein
MFPATPLAALHGSPGHGADRHPSAAVALDNGSVSTELAGTWQSIVLGPQRGQPTRQVRLSFVSN